MLRDHLSAPGIDAQVGTYADCSGLSPIPQGVSRDTCVSVPYFVGHNPGVFAPLAGYGTGTVIDYWDHSGSKHVYRVVAVRDWARVNGYAPVIPGAVAEFQTCVTPDAVVLRILDAVAG
jgi:hypothetical protein